MAANDRDERFAKIRTLLDFPIEQRPAPHTILNTMLMVEQELQMWINVLNPDWQLSIYLPAPNRSLTDMSTAAVLPEIADYLDVKSALFLLPYSEWGEDENVNTAKRTSLAASLSARLATLFPLTEQYLKKITLTPSFEMGYWHGMY